MRDSEDQIVSLNPITASRRDPAAEERDRAAEERDFAAQVRDGVAAVGRANPYSHQRELAAQDREEAAKDRRLAAKDREAANNELAGEGIDSLTGVMRRNIGLAAVQREMDRSERDGAPLVLAFVDVVDLKATNDTRGHSAGDRMLQDVAGCITNDLRTYDLVARIGGDEFVCTLSGQTVAQAGKRYEEMALRLEQRASGARMTVGLAAQRAGDLLGDLVDRADRAMIDARQ
jgi:diguanylate cyclase (GGDEF)-like protein